MISVSHKRLTQQKKQRERERKDLDALGRRHLSNVRVVQRNVVYIIGMGPRFAKEEVRLLTFDVHVDSDVRWFYSSFLLYAQTNTLDSTGRYPRSWLSSALLTTAVVAHLQLACMLRIIAGKMPHAALVPLMELLPRAAGVTSCVRVMVLLSIAWPSFVAPAAGIIVV
jgi:hypothetical protein